MQKINNSKIKIQQQKEKTKQNKTEKSQEIRRETLQGSANQAFMELFSTPTAQS